MKKSYFTSGLISSLFITMILLHFMLKTPSQKIIFVPFLVCSITMAGKYLALLLGKKKLAVLMGRLFTIAFLLFWFGFFIVAAYICIRDENYTMLLFTLPFWSFYFCIRCINIKRVF